RAVVGLSPIRDGDTARSFPPAATKVASPQVANGVSDARLGIPATADAGTTTDFEGRPYSAAMGQLGRCTSESPSTSHTSGVPSTRTKVAVAGYNEPIVTRER